MASKAITCPILLICIDSERALAELKRGFKTSVRHQIQVKPILVLAKDSDDALRHRKLDDLVEEELTWSMAWMIAT